MPTKSLAAVSVSAGCLLVLGVAGVSRAPSAAPAQVTLDMSTLHAATLSAVRNAADSSDAPYLLVSVAGSAGRTETRALPAGGHWALQQDGTIGKTPITTLTLQPGDSVRVLLTVLEDRDTSPQELPVATAATTSLADRKSWSNPPQAAVVTTELAPLTTRSAHWLGSASLLLTNAAGTTYWTSLDCVSTCKVLKSPAPEGGSGLVLKEATPQAAAGVVELSGASGTYHLQVAVRRAS